MTAEYIENIKKLLTVDTARKILEHLKDYKLVYSLLLLVSSTLGIAIEADKIAIKVVAVATFISTLIV